MARFELAYAQQIRDVLEPLEVAHPLFGAGLRERQPLPASARRMRAHFRERDQYGPRITERAVLHQNPQRAEAG